MIYFQIKFLLIDLILDLIILLYLNILTGWLAFRMLLDFVYGAASEVSLPCSSQISDSAHFLTPETPLLLP